MHIGGTHRRNDHGRRWRDYGRRCNGSRYSGCRRGGYRGGRYGGGRYGGGGCRSSRDALRPGKRGLRCRSRCRCARAGAGARCRGAVARLCAWRRDGVGRDLRDADTAGDRHESAEQQGAQDGAHRTVRVEYQGILLTNCFFRLNTSSGSYVPQGGVVKPRPAYGGGGGGGAYGAEGPAGRRGRRAGAGHSAQRNVSFHWRIAAKTSIASLGTCPSRSWAA